MISKMLMMPSQFISAGIQQGVPVSSQCWPINIKSKILTVSSWFISHGSSVIESIVTLELIMTIGTGEPSGRPTTTFFNIGIVDNVNGTITNIYNVITAPALIIVGGMMMKNIKKIELSDYSESIPCFLMITGIPLTYSIADGLTMGFISYPLIKLLSGKGREVNLLMYGLAVLLIAYFIFVRSKI